MRKIIYALAGRAALLCAALVAVSMTLASCGGDGDDTPKIPQNPQDGLMTVYGKLTPTGKKKAKLYLDEKYGATSLSIPGFSRLRIVSDTYSDDVPNPVPYHGWDIVGDAEVSFLDSNGNNHWAYDYPNGWRAAAGISNNGAVQKVEYYARVPLVEQAEGKTGNYAYCIFRIIGTLTKGTSGETIGDNVIGVEIEYQSPFTPNFVKPGYEDTPYPG